MHGSTDAAHSAGEGKGATFVIKLPLTIAMVADATRPRVHPTARNLDYFAHATRLDGLRVLVVDDNPDARELANDIVSGAGAAVKTCDAAPEALAAIEEWRPDVLISDIEMPVHDGYELIRNVRALDPKRGGKTPAVALTAYGRPQDRVLALTAGFNMHVPKPVDPGELTTIVASVALRSSPQAGPIEREPPTPGVRDTM
jgi:CheY-like chemotaxis protein